MFARPSLFFTKNTMVLKVLSQTRVSRASIIPVQKPSNFSSIFSNLRFVRGHSSMTLRNGGIEQFSKNASININFNKESKVVANRAVGYWLLGTSTLVFGIVVLGGLTRLTESGLSITEWKPVTGVLPPLNEERWLQEFMKYQESPEFKQLNSHITLSEFKFIYSMEWGHRLVGRFIGLFFVLPALYFWKTGKFNSLTTKRVVGLTALLGLQGVIGWWMVKSGLDEAQLAERRSKPTVSQYRLTTHLGAAFLMYLGVLWAGMDVLNENKLIKDSIKSPESLKNFLSKIQNPALKKYRYIATGLLSLTFLTALSGGMVAGLDAGLIYNTFPHMGDDYLPTINELMSPIFAHKADKSDLWWRNLLENPTTVQLVHRCFAITTFFSVLAAHVSVARHKELFPKAALTLNRILMGIVTLQAALGISTLVYLVPIPLAAAHQAGALALLTSCLVFLTKLKRPRAQVVSYINKSLKQKLLKKQ
ncbi:uncharacterized protein PRCAT00001905001 [Priceomyces carsonii]|uniref:uncharacterized protein n=1 Tax=Priceomyces carsonii TaxID=28549 RepID=UPI002EDAD964|nr:unnamed protein product [Priceomyces carsonii]